MAKKKPINPMYAPKKKAGGTLSGFNSDSLYPRQLRAQQKAESDRIKYFFGTPTNDFEKNLLQTKLNNNFSYLLDQIYNQNQRENKFMMDRLAKGTSKSKEAKKSNEQGIKEEHKSWFEKRFDDVKDTAGHALGDAAHQLGSSLDKATPDVVTDAVGDATKTGVGWVFDKISRPLYGVQNMHMQNAEYQKRLYDGMTINERKKYDKTGNIDDLKLSKKRKEELVKQARKGLDLNPAHAFWEGFKGDEKPTGIDVLKTQLEGTSQANRKGLRTSPAILGALGLSSDITNDPLTFLGVGGGKSAVKATKEFADEVPELRNLSKQIAGYKIPKDAVKDTKLAKFLDDTEGHLSEDDIYGILGGRIKKSYRNSHQKSAAIRDTQANINILENHLRRVDVNPETSAGIQDAQKQLDLIRGAHKKLTLRRDEVAGHGASDTFADEVSRTTGVDPTDISNITEHSALADAIANSARRADRLKNVDIKYPSYVARQKQYNARRVAQGQQPVKVMSKDEWLDEFPDLDTSLGKAFSEHPGLTPEDRSGLLKEVRDDLARRDDKFGEAWQKDQKLIRELIQQRSFAEQQVKTLKNLEPKGLTQTQRARLVEAERQVKAHNTKLSVARERLNSIEATAFSRAVRNRITRNTTGTKSYRNPERVAALGRLEKRIRETKSSDAYYTGVKNDTNNVDEPFELGDNLDAPELLEPDERFMTRDQHYGAIQKAIDKERSGLESPVGDVEMFRIGENVPAVFKSKDGKFKLGILQTEKNPDGFVQWDEKNKRYFASWAQFKKVTGREISDSEKTFIKDFVNNANSAGRSRVGKETTNSTRSVREKLTDLREGFHWEQVLKGQAKPGDVKLAKEISKVFKKVPGTDKYSPFLKVDGENVFLNGRGFKQAMAKSVTEADRTNSEKYIQLIERLKNEPGLEDFDIPLGMHQALEDAGMNVPKSRSDLAGWLGRTARQKKLNSFGLSPEHLAFYRKFSETTNYNVGYVKGVRNKILYGSEFPKKNSMANIAGDIEAMEKSDDFIRSGAAEKHGRLMEELNKDRNKSISLKDATTESFIDLANQIDELKVHPRDPLNLGTGSLHSTVSSVKQANKKAYRDQVRDLVASKKGVTESAEITKINRQIQFLQREEKRMEIRLAEAETRAKEAHKSLSQQMVDQGLMQVIARRVEPDKRGLYLKTWGDIELFRIPGSRAMFNIGARLNSPEFLTKSVDIYRRSVGSQHVGEQVKFTDPFRKLFGSSSHLDSDLQLARARYMNQTSTIVGIHMDEVRNSPMARMKIDARKDLFSALKKGATPDTPEAQSIVNFMSDFSKYLKNDYAVGDTFLTVDDIAKYLPEHLSIASEKLTRYAEHSLGDTREFAKILGTGTAGNLSKASDPVDVVWHLRIAAEQALARKAFTQSINDTFGVKLIHLNDKDIMGAGDQYKSKAAIAAIEDLRKKGWKSIPELDESGKATHLFPPEIHRDLTKLTEVLKPRNVGTFLNAYDDITKAWKVLATIYNPGYYSRNFIGEVMTGWFGGVNNPAYYRRSAKLIRYVNGGEAKQLEGFLSQNAWEKHMLSGQIDSTSPIATLANGQKLTLADVAVLYQDSGLKAGFINTELREKGLRGGLKARSHLLTRPFAKTHETLRHAGELGEDFPRLAHFLHGLEHAPAKFSPEKAAQYAAEQVRKYHFDYSDVTHFEKAVMMRLIPFYKWTRKAMPLMTGMLFEKPGKINAYPKLMHNISEAADPDQEGEGLGPAYDAGTAAYLKDAFSYGLGFDEEGKQTRLGIQTPQTDALKAVFDPVGTAGMMTNPLIKAPIEQLLLNRSFTNYDEDGYSNLGERATGLAQYQPFLKLLAKGQNRKDSVTDDNGHLDETMLSFLSGLNVLEDTGYDNKSRSHRDPLARRRSLYD